MSGSEKVGSNLLSWSKLRQQSQHVIRKRGFQGELYTGSRMDQLKPPGMQHLTAHDSIEYLPVARRAAIDDIPQNRMPHSSAMNPNLMGPSCLQTDFQQTSAGHPPTNPPMCDGGP